jgi:DNA/RNA-binding domain of Phe-tRNA-synthetase-like protein
MIVDDELKEKYDIRVVSAEIEGVKIEKSSEEFELFESQKIEEIKKKFDLENLKDNPIIRSYRDFYWRIGIDPTKIRPSSEALLRRVLSGKKIPRINNVVDSYNLASILTLISMGAYDLSKINGELRIRTSRGEKFTGIGGKELVTNGEIVMADKDKILNIYPYRDSELTKITEDTENAMLVLAGVKGIPLDYLKDSAQVAVEIITRFCGGSGKILE